MTFKFSPKKLPLLIPIGILIGLFASYLLVVMHPIYSQQTLVIPINQNNTIVSMDLMESGRSHSTIISDENSSGFICEIFDKELESSCRLEIHFEQEFINLSKYNSLNLYANYEPPTQRDFLRVSLRNFEPTVKSDLDEHKYKYNLVELKYTELSKPTNINFNRLIVPNWWLTKVRDQDVKSEVDLTKVGHIEIATGLHPTPGKYLLNASRIELNREVISLAQLYEYLIIFWVASIIVSFIIISIYLQYQVRYASKSKKMLEQINESLSLRSEKLVIRNQTDTMTGTLNRKGMEEKLKECLQNKWFPMSIVMVDIDFFKKINDVHGHQKGDHVLIELGAILNKFIQKNESVSRFGGEEFLLVIPNSKIEKLHSRLETLRIAIEAHDMGIEQKVTASIGFASCSTANAFKYVIEQADKALYQAKENGRNQVMFYRG